MSDAPPGTPAEAAVAALQDMGFAEDQCREALRLSGNQVLSLLCLGRGGLSDLARAVADGAGDGVAAAAGGGPGQPGRRRDPGRGVLRRGPGRANAAGPSARALRLSALMLGGGCAQAVQMLTQMGFPADGVFDALRATNNDADEACTWLMESAADADMSMGEWRPELACPTVGCRQRC